MTHIEQAIAKQAPGYVLTEAQREAITRNPNPAAQADALPGLLQSLGESLLRYCPGEFDWRIIPVEWLLDHVNFAVFRRGSVVTLNELGSTRGFELGGIVERCKGREHDIDLICAEYQRRQGRNPDHAGLLFWLDALEGGNRSAVFAAMVEGLG